MKKTALGPRLPLIATVWLLAWLAFAPLHAARPPLIFPLPQTLERMRGQFTFDEHTQLLVPSFPSAADLKLARFLIRELSDQYGVALRLTHATALPPAGNAVIMGTIDNPLVQACCAANHLTLTAENPGKEGYVLRVSPHTVLVAGWDDAGAFYGLQSLRQILARNEPARHTAIAPCVRVRDWPEMPLRGIRLYVPGPDHMAFFRRFLRDFMARYKYNWLIMEVNCMRLDRHPEVNAGWIEFAKYMKYTRTSELTGIHGQRRNSGHQDAGDGRIVEKADVRELVQLANDHYIQVTPEIPSLTHGYYLLTRHPELAEYPQDIWPDTYCPSNPATYRLLFGVFDEYIEVMHPKLIHIGHDEWWGAPLGVCPRCRGKDYSELFARDVNAIHDYLAKRGIRIALWGDFLLESVRGVGPQKRVSDTGYHYQIPGGLRPEVVEKDIPKDILVFNWFWRDPKKDQELRDFGFQQVYGNFKPDIPQWKQRIRKGGVLGGAPSSWAATDEYNFGKDLIADFLGCANLLWSPHTLDQARLGTIVRSLIPDVRARFRGCSPPSQDGDPVRSIALAPYCNWPAATNAFPIRLPVPKTGVLHAGRERFTLSRSPEGKWAVAVGADGSGKNPLPHRVAGIAINEDVTSLIFLHACARPAHNRKVYFDIHNPFDSADLLGWYEIVYEDGYTLTVPVQYGVNILEWNPIGPRGRTPPKDPDASPQLYCYEADAVECSTAPEHPATFYAFEWVNPRLGKKIASVNVVGSRNYQSLQPVFSHVVTRPMEDNALLLLGLSKVVKRPAATSRERQ